MAGTTIGEVNINLRMSLAQFKTDVQDGTRAASDGTKSMANEIGSNSKDAQASLALIGEEIGVTIPRHIRNFITALPGVAEGLSTVFNSVAVVTLIGLIVEATEKVNAFWQSLSKLSESEQKLLDDATKSAKDLLDYQTTLLKAEYDLQIAKASGLDKDKLRVDEMTALVGLNKNYADGLEAAKAHLQDLLNTQTALANKAMDTAKAAGVSPQSGANLYDMLKGAAAEKSAEGTKEKIDELTKSIGLANAALQEVQADSINAGDALDKHVAQNAEKSKEQLDKISDAVFKLQSRLGVPANLQINAKVDPQLFEVGAMLEKLAQPQLPLYSGTKEAEDLYKIQTQSAAAIAESQKVYTATRTSAQQYAEEVDKLDELWLQGRIDLDTYNKAIDQAKQKYDSTTIAVKQFGTDIADALKSGALWGSNWKDTLESIAIDLAQLILKLTLIKSLQESTAATGAGGFWSSLLSGFAGIGAKASGGGVSSGQPYIVGEEGPELFMPDSNGTIIPNGTVIPAASGGNAPITVHIHGVSDFDSFKKSKDQLASDVFGMLARAQRRSG